MNSKIIDCVGIEFNKNRQIIQEKGIKKSDESLDENQVDYLTKKIKTILDKSKCYDIFQKTKVNGMKMYTQKRTIKDVIQFSIEIKNKERNLKKIQIFKKLCPYMLNGYNNLGFIQLTLREIKLTK